MKHYTSLCIDSAWIKALIIGGGDAALWKLKNLLNHKVRPVIISPAVSDKVAELISSEGLQWEERPYCSGDIEGYNMVIVASSDQTTNEVIKSYCKNRNILYDDTTGADNGNFILPAVMNKYPLQIAVSSSGTIPTLSQKIRDFIASQLPEDTPEILNEISEKRKEILRSTAGDKELKRKKMREILNPMINAFIEKIKL